MVRDDEIFQEPSLLEAEIAGIKEWMLEKYVMNKVPEDRTLRTLLDGYTKEKMLELSKENGFEAKRRWKKEELVNYLADCILKNLEERLMILGKPVLQLLQRKGQDKLLLSETSNEADAYYLRAFPAATRMGLLVSLEREGKAISYVPDEVMETLAEVLSNYSQLEKEYAKKVTFWKELEDILHAGVALYGVLFKGSVFDLWKVYNPKMKILDVEDQIAWMTSIYHYIPLLAMRNNFYLVNEGIIGSDMFADEAEAERFYSNLPHHSVLDKYQPTKSDLNQYMKYSFDRRSTYYKKLKRLVTKQQLNLPFQNIMRFIETNIQMDRSLSDLISDFKWLNVLEFRTFRDLEKFTTYYTDLHNHSRLWQLRGHTPVEVQKMRQ